MTVRLVALGIVAALLCLLAYGVLTTGRGSPLDAAVARGERPAAPALALPPLEGGGATSLAAYRGRVVVLNYWASWCTPCRQEAPLLERWQARVARRGGTVLGVDALDVTTDARKFIREFHITYPVLRDRDGDTQKALRRHRVSRDDRARPARAGRRSAARPGGRRLPTARRPIATQGAPVSRRLAILALACALTATAPAALAAGCPKTSRPTSRTR